MKLYNIMHNVGKVKYLVNYHDGVQKNKDGSLFFGARCFSNKKKFEDFQKELLKENYVYGNSDFKITRENINLYYEFMSDEDLLDNSLILITGSNGINQRFNKVVETLNLSKDSCGAYNDTVIYGITNENPKFKQLNVSWGAFILRYEIFGIKDTLKPIDEYIKEIKKSEAYKNAKPLCQIEIPDYIQLEDFKEVPRDELFKYLDKTIGKKKWRVQTERTNIYGYRLNSSDSNKIVGLMIVRPNVSKEENTKFYICNK